MEADMTSKNKQGQAIPRLPSVWERLYTRLAPRGFFGRIAEFYENEVDVAEGSTNTDYVGNNYRDYDAAIEEINKKINCIADWGVIQTSNIVGVRAAFIMSRGLKVVGKGETEEDDREVAFLEEMLKYNAIEATFISLCKEAEAEGKMLLQLYWDPEHIWRWKTRAGGIRKERGMVKFRWRSWSSYQYKITANADDYMKYEKVSFKMPKSGKDVSIEEPNFIYRKFGGRLDAPNTTSMRLWQVLTQIESLDKALRDWREINHLYAGPFQDIECQTKEDVEDMNTLFQRAKNFKKGRVFIHIGKASFLSPPMDGVESLEKEIISNAKMISGTTGVPVHFLGLPEQLSNRSTAENLMGLVEASTRNERAIWQDLLRELWRKAIDLRNRSVQTTPLDPRLADLVILALSEQDWDRLATFYLPAVKDGKISLETFLSRIPDLDVEKEIDRLAEESKKRLDSARVMFGSPSEEAEDETAATSDESGEDVKKVDKTKPSE